MSGLSRNRSAKDQQVVSAMGRQEVSRGFGEAFEPLAKAHGIRSQFAFATQVEPGVDRQPV